MDAGTASTAPRDAGPRTKKRRVRRPAGQPNAQPAADEELDETAPPTLTDADRRLEWRGDEVALPTRKLDAAADHETRPLDDGEIASTLSSQGGAVRECVVKSATGVELRGSYEIGLLVDGNGRVTKSRMHAAHYLFEMGLLSCVKGALGRMKFPATGAPTKVTFPIDLR